MNVHRSIALSIAVAAAGCGGSYPGTTDRFAVLPATRAATASPAPIIYAYSPDGAGLVAGYPSDASGTVKPLTILSGRRTRFEGGAGNLFGGAIEFGTDGTLYVFDGTRAMLLIFPSRKGGVAAGNVPPQRVETLPQNSNAQFQIPQYAGFAFDGKGHFWTVDRSKAQLAEFPLDAQGSVKPIATPYPKFDTPQGVQIGRAQTVTGDGHGGVFVSCQAKDLALQLYGITRYQVTRAGALRFKSSFYGIPGPEDSQVPAQVLHVDPVTQTIYVGLYKPALVLAYPVSTPTGKTPQPRYIGGISTMLDATVASLTTDSKGVLYVAIGSSVVEFGPHAHGNAVPLRVLSDPVNLQYLGSAFGNMLTVGRPEGRPEPAY